MTSNLKNRDEIFPAITSKEISFKKKFTSLIQKNISQLIPKGFMNYVILGPQDYILRWISNGNNFDYPNSK